MNDIQIQVTDYLTYCKIKFVNESSDNFKYALYIYDKDEIVKLNYSDKSDFIYFYKFTASTISLKFFIMNMLSSETIMRSFPKFYSYRSCVSLDNLSFKDSFEADYISKWRTPIKYIKNDRSKNKKLVVFLNGALSSKVKYPVYNRISWNKRFDADCLYIYDSSLSQNIDYLLAWYIGNYQNILYKDIIRLIDKAKDDLVIKDKDIIFYGSSGGGFAALKLAECFSGSTAVAINPQTEIFRYSNKEAVDKFMKFTFNRMSISTIEGKYKKWIKIDPNAFRVGCSKFIYVQNIIDGDHYRNHLVPFWMHFSENIQTGYDKDNHNQLIIYEHPSGHAGEPPEVFDTIASRLNIV